MVSANFQWEIKMFKTLIASAFSVLIATAAYAGGPTYGDDTPSFHGNNGNGNGNGNQPNFGAAFGGSADFSAAGNFALTQQFGSSTATATTQSYGQSESTFQGEFSNHGASFGGTVDSASGSQSQATTTANGNGFSSALTGGFGTGGGVSFGGAVK